MPIATEKFERVGTARYVTKHQRTVETPMPTDGYTTEENDMTLYEVEGDGYIKVYKVSDLGWRIALYDADGNLDAFHTETFDDEDKAHESAREYVEERHE